MMNDQILDLDEEKYRLPPLQIKVGGDIHDFHLSPAQVTEIFDIATIEANGAVRGQDVTNVVEILTGEKGAAKEDRLFSTLNFKQQEAIALAACSWIINAIAAGKKKEPEPASVGSSDSTA